MSCFDSYYMPTTLTEAKLKHHIFQCNNAGNSEVFYD